MSDRERQVFDVVKAQVLEVLPDLDPATVTPERSLVELGANSIDRVEVAMASMEALGLQIPRTALAGVGSLSELVQVFCRHLG
jgi:polyketide biosynthesis acyl carrier protein